MDTDKYDMTPDARQSARKFNETPQNAKTEVDLPPRQFSSRRKTRKPKGFKIALCIIAILFVLAAAGLYFLPYFLPMDTIRNIAKTRVKEMLNMDLDFKTLRFSWNGSVVVDGISLAPFNQENEPGAPLLTVDEVRTNIAVSPLLRGKIVVNNVEVDGYAVHLRREQDGKLNLPDFSQLALANQQPNHAPTRQRLSAAVAAETASALPPIEIHRVNLNKGILTFDDRVEDRSLTLGLDVVTVEGSGLNDPFTLTGRALPYPDAPDKGEIPFSGRIAMLKDGELDLEGGEAALELDVRNFAFHGLAEQLGFGRLLASGSAAGLIQGAYKEGKALLTIPNMRLENTAIGLDDDKILALPDTNLGFGATYDPGPGVVTLSELSMANDLNNLKAKGWMEGVNGLADGLLPAVAIDYTGVIDFAKARRFADNLDPAMTALPAIEGSGSYFGKLALPRSENRDSPLAPSLTLDFNEGNLTARDDASGIALNLGLSGLGVKATAALGGQIEVTSAATFQNLPVNALIPQLSNEQIAATVNGAAAATVGDGDVGVELRLQNAKMQIPATPWSAPMTVTNEDARITYDLKRDVFTIASLAFDINQGVKGKVTGGTFSGILAGNPQGQAVIEMATVMETVRAVFRPLIPDFATKLAGTVQSSTQIKVEDKAATALIRADVDNADVAVTLPDLQGAARSPKISLGLLAAGNIDNPTSVSITTFEVRSPEATVQLAGADGDSASGRLGIFQLKAAGVVDAKAGAAEFSALSLAGNGLNFLFGRDGKQVAGLESGTMQMIMATPENKLFFPIDGIGDFNLPAFDAAMENLVFYRLADNNRETSNFGNVRARIGVDGYIGPEKKQIVNLRTAAFSANPLAAQARGQLDLDSGALILQYASRLAPAGMSSLLQFFKLPPALLDDAAASGQLTWNGKQADSKGTVQGKLRLASGEINPFEMNHDLSAAYDADSKSIAVAIRRMDGTVKTGSGEAVVTLAAQPSNLLLSRTGSKGLLDIRIEGEADPTRQLALGLVGVLPQLRDISELLYKTQAGGVYQAWLQLKEKESNAVGLTMGGIWKGAALQIDGVPYLAEAGQLATSLEGEFAFQDNRVTFSKLFFRSDSGLVQADGTVQAVLATDAAQSITGLSNIAANLRFVLADLTKLPLAFPGLVPADLGLAGKITGAFKAGGDASDIRVDEGVVQFQGFRIAPGGMEATIPAGNANFGATLALQTNTSNLTGSPYDVFKLFNLSNGQATLTGAQLQGRPVNTLAGSFDLQNGVLTLRNGQMTVDGEGGASAVAAGTVDFNQPAPAADLQVAVRNFPMAQINPEIADYFSIQSGTVNLPASGQAARVMFAGFSEDEILRTLRLESFNFVTSPVVIHTGPVLNTELDKARALMKQEVKDGDQARVISFDSISGEILAANGTITIPSNAPINVVGNNTADFRVQGEVRANHTLDLEFFIVGKLQNLIGFTLPNIIPNLRSGSEEERNRFMAQMNKYAAEGRYRVKLTGPLDHPDLSGIGEVAGRFMVDIVRAAPGQIIGGGLDLVKDTPGAVLDAAGAILNPENITHPGNLLNVPKDTIKGIGRAFGIGRSQETPQQ